MRCVRGFVAFLALATVGWLAFVPATTVATNPAPEHLITGFSDAPNPDAIFYAINKASAADSATLRKAALAYIGDNDQKTRYAALYALGLKAARTPEQIATTKPEWDRWWQKAGDSVHYDPQTRRFVE